jgi:hypothetical protein
VSAPSGIFNIMNIPKKIINGGLLFYAGGQVLTVGAGLAHHYSQQQIAPIVLTIEAPRYSMQELLYGAITKPYHPADFPQNPTFEYKLTLLVAGTTGSSGYDATMVFPV